MALDLTANHREWQATAAISGSLYRLTGLPTRSIGFDRERSSCSLAIEDVPSLSGGEAGQVRVGWNGSASLIFFTGLVQTPAAATPSMQRTIQLTDQLGLLQRSFSADITWSSTTFAVAVTDILTAVGVSATDIVVLSTANLTLGSEEDIVIAASESPAMVWKQLMDYAGTRAVVYPNGKVYILDISSIPSTFYNYTYACGASGSELGISSSGWSLNTMENPVIDVTITGPTRADGVTPTGNAVLTGVVGRKQSTQMRFVQTAADADAIADRELSRHAVPRKVLRFTADANPYLMPGMTIGYRDSTLGISSAIGAFVWSVDIQGPTMTVTCYVGLHLVDGASGLQDPVAVAAIVAIDQEPLIIAGSEQIRYLVQFDGSGSFDMDGEIVNYDWTFTGGSPSPSTSTEANPIVVFTTLDGTQTATLTVEDNHGNTGSVTITIPAAEGEAVVRELLVAENTSDLALLPDGETWFSLTATPSCTAVPPFNEQGQLLSGWSDGGIRAVNDDLSGLTLLATLGGGAAAISALYVNEGNANDVLAAAGTALYRSTDGATSFGLLYTFADAITDVQNSPSNPDEIRVASGRYVKISFDGGANWDNAITGASGTTAQMIASAPWGHAAVFTGGASSSDAIKFEEGHSVDWSAVTSPPTSLRAITPLLWEEAFFVGDGSGNIFKLNQDAGGNFDADEAVTISGNPQINDVIRDGALPGLSYWATASGSYKLTNGTAVHKIRNNAGVQIGYGVIGRYETVDVELLYAANGETSGGTNDKLWRYVPGVGWSSSALPVNGRIWFFCRVSPSNADLILIIGNTSGSLNIPISSGVLTCSDGQSPAFISDDGGATWTALVLTADDGGVATATVGIMGCWSNRDRWAVACGINTPQRLQYWTGDTTGAITGHFISASGGGYPAGIADGLNGEIILSIGNRAGAASGGVGYVAHDSSTFVLPGSLPGVAIPGYALDRLGGLSRETHFTDVTSGRTSDYRSLQPTGDGDTVLDSISASAAYIYGVVSGDLYRRAPGGTFAQIRAGGGSSGFRGVRVDRQTRTALALPSLNTLVLASFDVSKDDGNAWQTIAAPSGSPNAPQPFAFEIIVRSS